MGRLVDETLRDVAYTWRGLRAAPGLHRRGTGHAGVRRGGHHRHRQRRPRAAGPAAALPRSRAAGVRVGRPDRRGLSTRAAVRPGAEGSRRPRVPVRRVRRDLGDDRGAHRRERSRSSCASGSSPPTTSRCSAPRPRWAAPSTPTTTRSPRRRRSCSATPSGNAATAAIPSVVGRTHRRQRPRRPPSSA